jgi:hypothetical protein
MGQASRYCGSAEAQECLLETVELVCIYQLDLFQI